jgi:hypothetical protein
MDTGKRTVQKDGVRYRIVLEDLDTEFPKAVFVAGSKDRYWIVPLKPGGEAAALVLEWTDDTPQRMKRDFRIDGQGRPTHSGIAGNFGWLLAAARAAGLEFPSPCRYGIDTEPPGRASKSAGKSTADGNHEST